MPDHRLSVCLALITPLALPACDKNGDGGSGDPLADTAETLAVLLGSDPADDRVRDALDAMLPARVNNDHMHGTCETPKDEVVVNYDIRGAFSFVANDFDLSAKYLTGCGEVDDARVVCSPGAPSFPAGEVVVTGFTLGGEIPLDGADRELQISIPLFFDSKTPWPAIDAYPCDYWRYFTTFQYAALTTDSSGMVDGEFHVAETDGTSIFDITTAGRAILNGNSVIMVVPSMDYGMMLPSRYSVGIDGRISGMLDLRSWLGGDREPAVEEDDPMLPGFLFQC